MEFTIRRGTVSDLRFMGRMLYEAVYWDESALRPPFESSLEKEELSILLADWGEIGDTALVAEDVGHQGIGAAWYRFWTDQRHSYGYVSPGIPEMAIAVDGAYRRQGVGAGLLSVLIETARSEKVQGLSLSVDRNNPAVDLYRKFGFKSLDPRENSHWTMLLELA